MLAPGQLNNKPIPRRREFTIPAAAPEVRTTNHCISQVHMVVRLSTNICSILLTNFGLASYEHTRLWLDPTRTNTQFVSPNTETHIKLWKQTMRTYIL